MKGPSIHLLLLFIALLAGFTAADCVFATDSDDQVTSAGYDWEFAGDLNNNTWDLFKELGYNASSFNLGETYDGEYKIDLQVIVPAKVTRFNPAFQFTIKNGITKGSSIGERVISVYRVSLTYKIGLEHTVRYLIRDNQTCTEDGRGISFTADNLVGVAAHQLIRQDPDSFIWLTPE